MDLLHIHDFKIMTIVGMHTWEQQTQQSVMLDIDIACDCKELAQTDQIDQAINYDTVCEYLLTHFKEEKTALIETLAEKIAQSLLRLTGSSEIYLKLSKPGATRYAKTIAVSLHRKK